MSAARRLTCARCSLSGLLRRFGLARATVLRVAALGLWAAGIAGSAPARAELSVVELRPHDAVLDVALADLDGDGTRELVVASARETGPRAAERFLTVYRVRRGSDGSPTSEPISERSVPDDVVAFGLGDLLGTGRPMPIYFTARSVFALDADGRPRPVVRGHRFLFTMPSHEALPFWDAVADLDGDGRDDLLLAGPTGYGVHRQTPEGMLEMGRFEVGAEYASEPLRRSRRLARMGGPVVTRRALRLVSRADVNADQRIDLIAMKQDALLAFPQAPDGRFPETGWSHRLVAPGAVPFADTGAVPPPEIAHADINGDGRVDFVVPELDLRDLITRLRIFLASPDGLPERPSQILKLSSLGNAPELVDINGDGYVDLGCTTFRSDRLLSIAAGEIESLEFTYYGFLFRPDTGLFSTRPDVRFDATWKVPDDERPADESGQGGEQDAGFIRFGGDLNGDGVRDAVRFSADGEFRAHLVRVSGDDRMSVSVESEPLLEGSLPPTPRVVLADVSGDGHDDAVLVYPDVVRVVVSP